MRTHATKSLVLMSILRSQVERSHSDCPSARFGALRYSKSSKTERGRYSKSSKREREKEVFKIQQERERQGGIQNPARERQGGIQNPARERQGVQRDKDATRTISVSGGARDRDIRRSLWTVWGTGETFDGSRRTLRSWKSCL